MPRNIPQLNSVRVFIAAMIVAVSCAAAAVCSEPDKPPAGGPIIATSANTSGKWMS